MLSGLNLIYVKFLATMHHILYTMQFSSFKNFNKGLFNILNCPKNQSLSKLKYYLINYYDDMLITPKLTPWPKFSFPREKKLRLRNYRVHAYE